ncbi:hypothetical protein J2W17_002131 [Pseudomonas lini]|nr:hypothetical protein [Pseudomonas lini]
MIPLNPGLHLNAATYPACVESRVGCKLVYQDPS